MLNKDGKNIVVVVGDEVFMVLSRTAGVEIVQRLRSFFLRVL